MPRKKPSVKFDPAPEQKKNILTKFLTASEEEDVTHIAFINKKTPETSSWTYAHELGRLYLKRCVPWPCTHESLRQYF